MMGTSEGHDGTVEAVGTGEGRGDGTGSGG